MKFFMSLGRNNASSGVKNCFLALEISSRTSNNSSSVACGWSSFYSPLMARPHRKKGLEYFLLNILGNINYHWSRSATCGQVKGFLHNFGKIFRSQYQITVLHNGEGSFQKISFLKCSLTDELLVDLPGYGYQGNAIHKGIGNAGD